MTTKQRIRIPEYIETLKPYRAGNQKLASGTKSPHRQFINLASNENPLGGPPKAISAVMEAAFRMNLYPDPGSTELTEFLSKETGRSRDEIICGHGSESLLAHILNAFLDSEHEVVTASATFVGIYVETHKLGRRLVKAPMKNYGYDLNAIAELINEKTGVVYIANPNNPTGTMVSEDEFEEFLHRVPPYVVVVLDEAYYTYAVLHKGYPNGLNYELPNLIVLRTLSKTHSLAGIRVGYAVGPVNLIETLYKVKLPFEPSLLAQKAAVAALQDEEFVKRTLEVNTITLDMICGTLDKLGIQYPAPAANFVMAMFPDEEFASKFVNSCYDYGILVRQLEQFGLDNGVRISTGTESETKYAIGVFEEIYNNLNRKSKNDRGINETGNIS